MQKIIKSAQRGHNSISWLKSWHTFSFGQYYNPENIRFGTCRVINDDIILGGGGFAPHGHDNMEIVTYILSGALEHKDSLGTGSVIRRGDIQRMSAGTGITHSEFNHSATEPVHLLQIWFFPKVKNIEPSYAQKFFGDEEKLNKLLLIASEQGHEASVNLNQDVDIYSSILEPNVELSHTLKAGRKAWVHVATGALRINGEVFEAGDGIGFDAAFNAQTNAPQDVEIKIAGHTHSEFVLFDMG